MSELLADEASVRKYLELTRWPDGVICPYCGSGARITVRNDGYYRCNACKIDFTVRVETILGRSHVPLQKWMRAIYLLATAHDGITSMRLANEIGITQKSAWFVLRRLREALGNSIDRQECPNAAEILDRVTGVVLRYKPKPKSKAARRRALREKRKI